MIRVVTLFFILTCMVFQANAADAADMWSDDIDFASLTCEAFVEDMGYAADEDVGFLLMWLDGYLSGLSGDTRLNARQFEAFCDALVDLCAEQPKAALIDAARTVGLTPLASTPSNPETDPFLPGKTPNQ